MPWEDIKLNDGRKIPGISYGTSRHSGDTVSTVDAAIHAGFDSLDTAQIYRSEGAVGQAIKQSGIPRNDLWITTKWSGLKSAKESIHDSLENLGVDYVDLYLIHFPAVAKGDIPSAWGHLEDFKKAGYAKSIGVSNFEITHLKELLYHAKIKPSVNQIPFHPNILAKQEPLVKYLQEHNIAVEGYSPLAPLWQDGGNAPVLKAVKKIAEDHEVPEERVLLAWTRAKGVIPVTSSSTKSRIESFIAAGDLRLSDEEVKTIDKAGYKASRNADLKQRIVTGAKWVVAAGLVTYIAVSRMT
ncbi:uncharacterized protein I303_105121 [Kwoniella dejecticola CBS 10117]|uniref:NADP-dependent oxidoreductase domain-containing protein n=1 Tax=Kwoniella dejecticola CBS 10117 TaxID=1296121 RepID=A0A1A6A3E2_9TREE|nr:uncharacterized protein I303_05434 [Kwoniella dejecticola CBS 10117]OBR84575.1 hypothetical protein I303_05434 [Kwoniella dejecticola CBS 10117]